MKTLIVFIDHLKTISKYNENAFVAFMMGNQGKQLVFADFGEALQQTAL